MGGMQHPGGVPRTQPGSETAVGAVRADLRGHIAPFASGIRSVGPTGTHEGQSKNGRNERTGAPPEVLEAYSFAIP